MRYADFLLGELIDTLKANGQYDESLIIVTSDHGFMEDPRMQHEYGNDAKAYIDDRTHVPLIVKAPHQVTPERRKERFDLINLHFLIEKAADMPPMFEK